MDVNEDQVSSDGQSQDEVVQAKDGEQDQNDNSDNNQSIPKYRFDEVNNKMKTLMEQNNALMTMIQQNRQPQVQKDEEIDLSSMDDSTRKMFQKMDNQFKNAFGNVSIISIISSPLNSSSI